MELDSGRGHRVGLHALTRVVILLIISHFDITNVPP